MEKGYYWIQIPESESRHASNGYLIGWFDQGYFEICGCDEIIRFDEVTIGPRVKGQEECQSND